MLLLRVPSSSSPAKGLYDPKAFVTHAASLDQGCPHCPRFPTAASRRSLGRVSVPVWPIVLSDRLRIAGTVGHYPTVYLIRRGPLSERKLSLVRRIRCYLQFPAAIPDPKAGSHVLLTRPPLTKPRKVPCVRLACVRRAASVRSEPGSNSQLEPRPSMASRKASTQSPNGTSNRYQDMPDSHPPPSPRTRARGQRRTPPAHPSKNASKKRSTNRRCQTNHPDPTRSKPPKHAQTPADDHPAAAQHPPALRDAGRKLPNKTGQVPNGGIWRSVRDHRVAVPPLADSSTGKHQTRPGLG